MSASSRDRQAAYRARRRQQGHKAITVWLDNDAYAILERQAHAYPGDRSDRQAAVISTALRALDAVTSHKAAVISHVTSHGPGVTGDVTSHDTPVTDNVTSHNLPVTDNGQLVTSHPSAATRNAPSTARRYLPHELEDRILALRESGLSLRETASKLADEGCLNSKGRPYSSSTILGAADRAKARRLTA